jgi:hypothetical protein
MRPPLTDRIGRGGATASSFIALSCDRNLPDKNEACGLRCRRFSPLEPEKESLHICVVTRLKYPWPNVAH